MSIRTCGLLLVLVLFLLSADTSPLPNVSHQYAASLAPVPTVVLCTENDTRCWSEGRLPHSDGSCYPALTRGPCPEGQWWLLRNGSEGGVRGRCSSPSCPPDANSRECRRLMQRVAAACPRRPDGGPEFAVHMDPKGDFRCGVFPGQTEALHALIRCLSLGNLDHGTAARAVTSNGRQCAQNDQGQCVEAVGGRQPGINLNAED